MDYSNDAQIIKDKNSKRIRCLENWCYVITAIITLLTVSHSILSVLITMHPEKSNWIDPSRLGIGIGGCLLVIALLWLFLIKCSLQRKGDALEINYRKEKRINSIHKSLFSSLYDVHASKVDKTLRYTYGRVAEWNPINYQKNVLTYDVHDQIRSILVSLENIIISLDPKRFNEKNVSVELAYCYPQKNEDVIIPISQEVYDRHVWKVISSGDTSGNRSNVLAHLMENDSFFSLLENCGTIVRNNKYTPFPKDQKEILQSLETIFKNSKDECFFVEDIKDIEWQLASSEEKRGTAIGTIIILRNDTPEKIFIKSLLTINTFGECIFVPEAPESTDNAETEQKKESQLPIDQFGMSEKDYISVFTKEILPTYSKLLEAEFSQMYIRHEIREGRIGSLTGRKIKT